MGDTDTRTYPAAPLSPGDASTATGAGGPAAPPAPPQLPTVPRYELVRRLGHGGMGVVYEAVGPLGVRVALKVVHPDKLTPTLLARFQQEARAMMDLAHPNLARIYDYGDSPSGPYFTMKLLPGPTLADRLPALRADPAAGVRLMARVADAVAHLHARGLVHRDLKPTNVLTDDRGEPFVSDFGLIKDLAAFEADGTGGSPATPAGGASVTLTHTGARLGTEAYMSPEQFAGEHAKIGPPTDVWALGVILHELAWEARPVFDAQRRLQLPTDDGSPIWTGLRPVVTRCLAWEPDDRYPTAADLRADLEALLIPPPAPAEPKPTRRGFVLAGGAGVLGLGAAGATWWAFIRHKDRGEPNPPDPLEEIQKELAEQGSVDLLRADGTWRWSEWITTPAEWTRSGDVGGFNAPKGRVRMLEVARGLPGFGFRFEVRLRHLGTAGEVGVYVGRSRQICARGAFHCLAALSVCDQGLDPDRAGNPQVSHVVLVRRCSADADGGFTDVVAIDRPRPQPGVPGAWMDATVSLDANGLVVRAGGREFKRRTRNQLLQPASKFGYADPGFEALTPTFRPDEGLGLFADFARVEVAGARLTRIDPP